MDKIKSLKKPAVLFFIFVVAFDLLIILLKFKHYYFHNLVGTSKGFLFPAILALISFCLYAKSDPPLRISDEGGLLYYMTFIALHNYGILKIKI